MVNLKSILVVFLVKCFSCVFAIRPHNGSNAPIELQEISSASHSSAGLSLMNGTLFQTVKRYHCAWIGQGNGTVSNLVLHGSKAWTFPNQDVTLELSYPDYRWNSTATLVTMFDVILRIGGGVACSGYITAGGILQDFITLTFILENISSLEYEFWLYGVPRWAVNPFDQFKNQTHGFC